VGIDEEKLLVIENGAATKWGWLVHPNLPKRKDICGLAGFSSREGGKSREMESGDVLNSVLLDGDSNFGGGSGKTRTCLCDRKHIPEPTNPNELWCGGKATNRRLVPLSLDSKVVGVALNRSILTSELLSNCLCLAMRWFPPVSSFQIL